MAITAVIFSVVTCSLESNCSMIVKKLDLRYEHSAWNFELFVSVIVTSQNLVSVIVIMSWNLVSLMVTVSLKVVMTLFGRSCMCLVDILTLVSVMSVLTELLSSHFDITTVPSVSDSDLLQYCQYYKFH